MEHHATWFTGLLNRLLGTYVASFLNLLGIHPHDPANPIPEYVGMEIAVFLLAVVFVLWFRRRLSVDRPGATQQCVEMFITNPMGVGFRDLLHDIVGHGSDKYLPMIGAIGLFVLLSNLISLIPGFVSPTAFASVPLACAVVVFLYYNYCGIRHAGPLGYAKHFLGPVPAMAPIMLPIEIVSHLARLLSLTVRLWVNMVVSELLYILFLGMTLSLMLFLGHKTPVGYVTGVLPLLFPIVFILLHLFVGFLQAFVFTLLPVIYVSGAVTEEH